MGNISLVIQNEMTQDIDMHNLFSKSYHREIQMWRHVVSVLLEQESLRSTELLIAEMGCWVEESS